MKNDHGCLHHEGMEFKIQANTKRIGRIESGFIWLYGLLLVNLGSVVGCLVLLILKSKG